MTVRGLFTVRAQRRQYGVRVVRLGHISVRSHSSQKNDRPLATTRRAQILFHHRGCLQVQDMPISRTCGLGGEVHFAASCGGAPLSIIKQYVEDQQRPQ